MRNVCRRGVLALTLVIGLGVAGAVPATAAPDTAGTTGIPTEFCKLFPVFCD